MLTERLRPCLPLCWLAAGCAAAACGDDGGAVPAPNNGEVPSYQVAGTAVDFRTGDPLSGTATLTIEGVVPPPTVMVTGAEFSIAGIPPSSVFHLLTGSPPDYRNTYNRAVEVVEGDVADIVAEVVSEGYLAELAGAFGVTPAPGTSVLLAQVVDAGGAPLAGVPSASFRPGGSEPPVRPYFLDADRGPAPGLDATSESGYVVFFNLPEGPISVDAAQDSGYAMNMAVAPVRSTTVTVAEIVAMEGERPMLPQNVSFSRQVIPIFEARNCTYCHSGGGIGRQDGNLSLQGGASLMYSEVAQEISPKHMIRRVNIESPGESLLLTLPGPEPDVHPNITFASTSDPDYQLIYAWIAEGAQNN